MTAGQAANDRRHQAVRMAAADYGAALLSLPNVFGYGVGMKVVGGEKTSQLSLSVFVERKVGLESLATNERIPSTLVTAEGEVATDVVPSASPRLTADTGTYRPLQGGAQLFNTGTLGGIVIDRTDGEVVLLTCNHVLTAAGRRDILDPRRKFVTQPYTNTDSIGVSKRVVPMLPTAPGDNTAHFEARVDAGIIAVDEDVPVRFRIVDLGRHPYVVLPPSIGMNVVKRGWATETTFGTVEHVDVTVVTQDHDGKLLKIGGGSHWNEGTVFSIRAASGDPFGMPGDSGSLVLDDERVAARGMLFSSPVDPSGLNFASALWAVFEELELETPCAGGSTIIIHRAIRRKRPHWGPGGPQIKDLLKEQTKTFRKLKRDVIDSAEPGSVGSLLRMVFDERGGPFSEAIVSNEQFAGLLTRSLTDLLLQPSLFEMLEYRPTSEFVDDMLAAFDTLTDDIPELEKLRQAVSQAQGRSVREWLMDGLG